MAKHRKLTDEEWAGRLRRGREFRALLERRQKEDERLRAERERRGREGRS